MDIYSTMPGAWQLPKTIPPSLSPINQNKTLYINKFTDEPPTSVDDMNAQEGLESVEDVFNHFQPEKMVGITDDAGFPTSANFKFRRLGDFTQQGLVDQSPVLQEQFVKMNNLQRIEMQLNSNKILKLALQDADAKRLILEMIQQMIDEIDQAS